MAKTIELDDFDFGFSAVSEEELQLREREAEARGLAQAEQVIKSHKAEAESVIDELTGTALEYKNKLMALHKLVQPLLANLSADSDKPYIYWPDRTTKMKQFMARINAVVSDD